MLCLGERRCLCNIYKLLTSGSDSPRVGALSSVGPDTPSQGDRCTGALGLRQLGQRSSREGPRHDHDPTTSPKSTTRSPHTCLPGET